MQRIVVAIISCEKTSVREFENSLVEAQQQMSERWIEIINLPTDLTPINDFVPDVQFQRKCASLTLDGVI